MTRRLADVASKVGVSEATVSRVLNGKPGVSEATRQAVLTALDVLGYERPIKLRGERARLVGLVLPELQNPIFPAFAEVVGGALAQQGFTPVLCTQTAGGVSEADYVELLLQQQVSGVVFAGGQLRARRERRTSTTRGSLDASLPTVLSTRPSTSCTSRVSPATTSRPSSRPWAPDLARSHRIGLLLGPADHVPSQRKLAAARRPARGTASSSPDRRARACSPWRADRPRHAGSCSGRHRHRLCERPPCPRRHPGRPPGGPVVPEDVSVVGYDDSALMSCTDPALTTVRQPIESMGRAAVELLVSQIEGRRDS